VSTELSTLRNLQAERMKIKVDLETAKKMLKDLDVGSSMDDLKKYKKQLDKLTKVRDKELKSMNFDNLGTAKAFMRHAVEGYKIQGSTINRMQESIKKIDRDITGSDKAKELLQGAAEAKEYEIRAKVEELVTRGLQAVFERPDYKFVMDLVIKRNRLSLDYYWEEELDGQTIKIKLHNQSGGVIDVTVMLLRVVFLSLFEDHSRFLALDEPFKHLSEDYIPAVADLLKKLKSLMKLQIVLITHKQELTTCGDKVLLVQKHRGYSKVKDIT